MKSRFEILNVTAEEVVIRDLCNEPQFSGFRSVTNDAEAVVDHLLKEYGSKSRLFYFDSCGGFDELAHDGIRFIGFKPARLSPLLKDAWDGAPCAF